MIKFSSHLHSKTKGYVIIILCLLFLIGNVKCQTCGNGLYEPPSQYCDDGNLNNGDGCSSACIVEPTYSCFNTPMVMSVCKINNIVNLDYVGVQRDTSTNSAILYFTLTPYFSAYLKVNFNGLLISNVPYSSMTVTYKPTQNLLEANFQYTQDIENTQQIFQLLLNQTSYFWNPSDNSAILLNGVNCELTYDPLLWMHNVMQYIVLSLVCIVLIVFITSIFFEKLIGLELVQTCQSVFFIFALMKEYPFQFSALYEKIRYSNGYDDILPSNYYRTYTLINRLNALAIEKQFLSNYNIMFMLITVAIAALIIIGLIKRKYRLMLEQQVSRKLTQKLQKMDKIYSFVFGRIFISLVFFSMFKVIFSFCIQLSNQHTLVQVFIDQIDITVGMAAFIIVFGMISYVLYWYLLLPKTFTEDQQFMTLRFQNMKFYYPIMYLSYQTLFIMILSIYYIRQFTIYVILALQCAYLIMLIITRPYNTARILNQRIDNFTIIFNQITTILMTSIAIRWNSILGTPYQVNSASELISYFFLILVLLILIIILAIVRLSIFNRQVTCCCYGKKVNEEIVEFTYDGMKKQLIDDKFKQSGLNSSINQNIKQLESEEMKKDSMNKTRQEGLYPLNDDGNLMLNDKYVEWAHEHGNQSPAKKTLKNIKKSTFKKKANFNKSSLQQYIEMQQLYERQKQSRVESNFQE